MRVTFKGYAFFLPTDCRGATVKIEGRVSVELHSAEEVQHLEEEGATFTNKRADGSALMTQFIAAAVEIDEPEEVAVDAQASISRGRVPVVEVTAWESASVCTRMLR